MLQPSATSPEITHSITTFMIANDPYLQKFVNKFTESNQGKLLYGLKRLRNDFEDYETNRKRIK
jgi:uncharacterized protein with von Willebrand factor type A (vWA) domain